MSAPLPAHTFSDAMPFRPRVSFSQTQLTAQLAMFDLHAQDFAQMRLDAAVDAALPARLASEFGVAPALSLRWQQVLQAVPAAASIETALDLLLQGWMSLYAAGVTQEAIPALVSPLRFRRWWQGKTRTLQQCLSFWLVAATAQADRHALQYAKRHHQISGLPNAQSLTEHLQQALLFSAQPVGFLLIHFQCSSTLAATHHQRLPALMTEIIARLQQQLPPGHALYHLEGDAFAVLSPQLDHPSKLDLLSAKLRRPFELTVFVQQQPYAVRPVMGGVCRQAEHQQATHMLDHARLALEHAQTHQMQFSRYSDLLTNQASATAQLRHDVIEAFENDRLGLYFQPIVHAETGVCQGAEALLRCRNALGEWLPPPFVVEVLYQQGLGHLFIRWLINTACRQASVLTQTLTQPFFLSINLTAEDLMNQELPHLLAQSLKLWGVEGSCFTLEVTENGLLMDDDTASQILQAFTALGCRIALDDFGTGYSSMARLRNLPIDLVKIDQSFVRNLAHSPQDKAIVQGIVTMAHGLGKKVVVEGVEDAASLAHVQALHCEKIQGFYYSRPLPFEQFVSWAQARQEHPASNQ